jgi:hypothetical protein
MKIVSLKERGEPVVISLPLSQVIYFADFSSEDYLIILSSSKAALFLIMDQIE